MELLEDKSMMPHHQILGELISSITAYFPNAGYPYELARNMATNVFLAQTYLFNPSSTDQNALPN